MMSLRREKSRRKGKAADDDSDYSERPSRTLSNKKKGIGRSRSRRREHRKRKSRSRSRSPHHSSKRRRRRSSSDKSPRRKRHKEAKSKRGIKSKRHKEERKKVIKKRHSSTKHPPKNEEKKPKPSHPSADSQNPSHSQALSPIKTDVEKENPYDNSDTESELNLNNPMERIVDYIDDKKELCHQTFKTLKGRKLRTMIPEILRSYNLVELRDMCHKELDGMSKKRVLRILNGDEPEIISSSSSSTSGNYLKSSPMEYDSALDSSMDSKSGKSNGSFYSSSSTRSISPECRTRKELRKKAKKVKHERRISKEKMSTPEAVVDSTCKIEETIPEDEMDQDKGEEDNESVIKTTDMNENVKEMEDMPQDVLEVSATDLNQDLDKDLTHGDSFEQSIREPPENTGSSHDRSVVIDQADVDDVAQHQRSKKKELEIIELEMRARAIRSMINAQTKDPRLRSKKV